jgi:HK97 gp10 family phage protein
MAADVRVVLDRAAIAALARTPQAAEAARVAGAEFAGVAAGLAPKATGAGAASIHATVVDGAEADVTWGADHAYMAFVQFGTKYMPARPFMDEALDHYAVF